jgi:hypothetical protein
MLCKRLGGAVTQHAIKRLIGKQHASIFMVVPQAGGRLGEL